MKTFEVPGQEPSLLPEGSWKLAWSDEFDGAELDRSKWDFRLNFWGKRFDAYTDEGIVLKDGNLEIHLVEKDGEFASAQLQTGTNVFDYAGREGAGPAFCGGHGIWPLQKYPEPRFLHRYGYYECRCKFQQQPGWWSAFWLQSQTPGVSPWDPTYTGIEVDIMENFERDGSVTSGNIYGNYGDRNREDARVRYTVDQAAWHRFGVHWSREGYVFYCDGVETARSTPGIVSKVPQFLLLTTECKWYRNKEHAACEELRQAQLPDCFTVDYVRVFDEVV